MRGAESFVLLEVSQSQSIFLFLSFVAVIFFLGYMANIDIKKNHRMARYYGTYIL